VWERRWRSGRTAAAAACDLPNAPLSAMYCLPSSMNVMGGPIPLRAGVSDIQQLLALIRGVGAQLAGV